MFKFIGGAIFGSIIGAAAGATCVGALVWKSKPIRETVQDLVAEKISQSLYSDSRRNKK